MLIESLESRLPAASNCQSVKPKDRAAFYKGKGQRAVCCLHGGRRIKVYSTVLHGPSLIKGRRGIAYSTTKKK